MPVCLEANLNSRPIKSEEDYRAALARIDELVAGDKAPPANSPEGDALDVLVTLVQAYEALHCAIGTPDPIEAVSSGWNRPGSQGKTWRPPSAAKAAYPRS